MFSFLKIIKNVFPCSNENAVKASINAVKDTSESSHDSIQEKMILINREAFQHTRNALDQKTMKKNENAIHRVDSN